MENRLKKKISYNEIFFLLMLFGLLLLMMSVLPFGAGPDEPMRYQIPQYIYRHLSLPRGDDPEVMNSLWGTSYAFSPINSYIVAALFMKVASIFSVNEMVLLYSARMVSVVFSMGTAIFGIKIGKKLFPGIYMWLFVVLVTLLPEFIFISGYVNCDSIAVFSVSWIIYALLCGKEQCWNRRSCLFLGAGLGICALSYYNAYGMIFLAAIYCILSVILDKRVENKFRFILIRTGWVFGSAFLIAGWWFIRNAYLYKGDILGTRASRECGEMHAIEKLKPSKRNTPYKMGYNLKYMLTDMRWIELSMDSFVAVFGLMEHYIDEIYYKLYYRAVTVGILGNVLVIVMPVAVSLRGKLGKISEKKSRCFSVQDGCLKTDWLLILCMSGMCVITIAFSIYNSYFNDFQPQGRYYLPMLVSLAILVTNGIKCIGIYVNSLAGKMFASIVCLYMFYLSFYSVFSMMLPQYI